MDLSDTSIGDLSAACRRESERYRRGEPSTDTYCFELFRRAVYSRDDAAWEAVVAQYRGIVLAWVLRQGGAVAADADYWVNRAFDRFWTAVRPERFGMFDGLPRVLKYLQMCAATAVLDEHRVRRATQHESLDELVDGAPQTARGHEVGGGDVETGALDRLSVTELWQAIVREVPEEGERTVLYCSFALGMKPAEIHERRPHLYPTVADVYRVKRNVLDRLRRSPAIRRLAQVVPDGVERQGAVPEKGG